MRNGADGRDPTGGGDPSPYRAVTCAVRTAASVETERRDRSSAVGVPYAIGRPSARTSYRSARGGNLPETETRHSVAGTPGESDRAESGTSIRETVTSPSRRTTLPGSERPRLTARCGSIGTGCSSATRRECDVGLVRAGDGDGAATSATITRNVVL